MVLPVIRGFPGLRRPGRCAGLYAGLYAGDHAGRCAGFDASRCAGRDPYRDRHGRIRFGATPQRAIPLLMTALLLITICIASSGCSLLTLKSPEIPLTARQQEARLMTRDYAAHFATTIAHLIDDAAHADDDPQIRAEALRLKLGAVTEITRASTGLSPIPSLLDTWTFSIQLRDYLVDGAGAHLLGDGQPKLSAGVDRLATEADAVGRRVAGEDYASYRAFVSTYAQHHPLETVDLVRSSVISAWLAEKHEKNSLRAAGTVAQALGDVSDRMRIYSERVPALGLWQAELALNRAGFDDAAYRSVISNFDAQLERISKLADTSPALAHEAIAEFRSSLRASSERLDASWMQMLRTLHAEREALAIDVAAEREGIAAAFDVERARVSADAAQITARAVDTSWRELRKLVREALLLIILLTLVVLGLPFAAGYLAGRRRGRRPLPPGGRIVPELTRTNEG